MRSLARFRMSIKQSQSTETEIDLSTDLGQIQIQINNLVVSPPPQDLRELARIPHPIEELRFDETIGTPPA